MAPALGLATVPGYKPSGKTGALAAPLLLLSLLVVPVIGAVLYDKLWHFGGFVIFSQLFLGALVGAMLFPAMHFGKIRNTVLAGILGGLIGAATLLGAMAFEAWGFRPQYIAGESAYIAQKYRLSPQKARAAAEGFYTPANTIKFYWLDRAQAGMSVSSTRSRSTSQISGTMFWVVEGVELLLVTLLAAVVALSFAQRRFSEEFKRWAVSKSLGSVHPLQVAPLLEAAQAGDFGKVRVFGSGGKTEGQAGAQIHAYYIPEKSGGTVSIKAITNKNKGLQPIFEREVTNEEMKALWPEFPVSSATASPFSS